MIPSQNVGESQADYEARILREAKPDLSLWNNLETQKERPFNVLGTTGGNGDLSVSSADAGPSDPAIGRGGDAGGGTIPNVIITKDGVYHYSTLKGDLGDPV